MRILLTNDDGYFSKGITMLDEMLSEIGEVTIVAPENNYSGASSSLTLKNPLRSSFFCTLDTPQVQEATRGGWAKR